jgi:hypothetical protein
MHHPTRTIGMLGANATMRMPSEPPTRPIIVQGRRMPSCDEVRSLILPKNGFPSIANRAPIPVTTAKLLGACSIPTSELTFNAKVTSRARGTPGWCSCTPALQRDETPSDPVRHGRLTLQRSLGGGSILPSIQPGGGRQVRLGGRGATPGSGNVGHCALPRRYGASLAAPHRGHTPAPPAGGEAGMGLAPASPRPACSWAWAPYELVASRLASTIAAVVSTAVRYSGKTAQASGPGEPRSWKRGL